MGDRQIFTNAGTISRFLTSVKLNIDRRENVSGPAPERFLFRSQLCSLFENATGRMK